MTFQHLKCGDWFTSGGILYVRLNVGAGQLDDRGRPFNAACLHDGSFAKFAALDDIRPYEKPWIPL